MYIISKVSFIVCLLFSKHNGRLPGHCRRGGKMQSVCPLSWHLSVKLLSSAMSSSVWLIFLTSFSE